MEGFQELFNNFDSQDSYAILAIMFIALLFGMLIGFLLRGSKIRRLKKELNEEKKKLTEAQAEIDQLQNQKGELEKKLKQGEYNMVAYTEKIEELEKEKAKLLKDVYFVNQQLEEVQSSNRAFNATIEDLENQIIGLKAKNEQLVKEMEEGDDEVNNIAQMQSLYNATRQQLETFESRLTHLDKENESLESRLTQLDKENESLESRLTHLDQENELLKTELSTLKFAQTQSNASPVENKVEEPLLSFVDESAKEPDPEALLKKDKSVLNQKIIIEEHEKDDLTLINGIGPFIEKKLNDIGIYTYHEISQFDAERIQQVTRDVAYFPGRIEKDDWVGQAAKLYKLKLENPDALKKKTTHPTDSENLKIVEGIGPKIEQLLKEGQINNWQDLAETSVERLQEILTAAGERYRIHDPSTWANQARLAAQGKWTELEQYQDELKGGRVVE